MNRVFEQCVLVLMEVEKYPGPELEGKLEENHMELKALTSRTDVQSTLSLC
jgi:hypothetical protein